jgi:hypothetical protein
LLIYIWQLEALSTKSEALNKSKTQMIKNKLHENKLHRKKTEVGGQKTEDGRQVIRLSENQGGGYQDSRVSGKRKGLAGYRAASPLVKFNGVWLF